MHRLFSTLVAQKIIKSGNEKLRVRDGGGENTGRESSTLKSMQCAAPKFGEYVHLIEVEQYFKFHGAARRIEQASLVCLACTRGRK